MDSIVSDPLFYGKGRPLTKGEQLRDLIVSLTNLLQLQISFYRVGILLVPCEISYAVIHCSLIFLGELENGF